MHAKDLQGTRFREGFAKAFNSAIPSLRALRILGALCVKKQRTNHHLLPDTLQFIFNRKEPGRLQISISKPLHELRVLCGSIITAMHAMDPQGARGRLADRDFKTLRKLRVYSALSAVQLFPQMRQEPRWF